MANTEKLNQIHIIDASAGSGKTYALAKKYLLFLMKPAQGNENLPYKNILAITFTNKATNEMKQRILEFLKKIALDAFSTPEEKQDIMSAVSGTGIKNPQLRAHDTIGQIIRNYDFFKVQTIDSFINSIITGCSFNLDISTGFNIETDYARYLDFCLDRQLEAARSDKQIRAAFMDFIEHFLYMENNQSWFPKQKMQDIIKSLFDSSNMYGLPFKDNTGITNTDIYAVKKEAYKLIESLSSCLPENVNGTFRKSLDNFLENESERFSLESLSKYFDKGQPVPINKNGSCPENANKMWETIQEKLKNICEMEAFSRYSTYLKVYEFVFQDFKNYTNKEDLVFLNELNKKARYLFDNKSLSVPELYYRFATRFKHYLVDEFQDTSRLQWTNLQPLVEEALASGGSFFYVGDKKQAIYGFRGGEYSLFDEVKENYKQYAIKEDIISRNYRSQKEIVDFNNATFSMDNLQRFLQDYNNEEKLLNPGQLSEITGIFNESQQEYKQENNLGYVKVENVQTKDKEDRNEIIKEKVISVVKELKGRGFGYEDICVLLRDNSDVELVTGWLLQQKDIPVESDNTLNIRENFLVKELFSFLSFLHFQPDNISFVSFILGDIFVKETRLDRKKLQDFFFEIGTAKGRSEQVLLYLKFREAFPDIWEQYIKEFTSRAGLVPLYEFIISILSKFNVLKHFPKYQGFIMAFLELVKTKEKENFGLEPFLEYFETAQDKELFANVTRSNSLKVMTIHKAKGLEFPVVIIPFQEINITEMKKKISRDFVIYKGREGLFLASLSKTGCRHSELIEKMYANEIKKSIVEELNTAYVAFTRPQKELYIFMPYKKDENIAVSLVPEAHIEHGVKVQYKDKKEAGSAIREIPPSDYSDWMKLIEYEFAGRLQAGDRQLAAKGEVIHYMLSCIDRLDNVEITLKKASEAAKKKYLFFEEFNYCTDVVKSILLDKGCAKLYSTDAIVFNEKEVVDSKGSTKRIDRLIVSEKEAWIVDYKISEKESDEHKTQVTDYMRIIGEIYPGKEVKGFLLYAGGNFVSLRGVVGA